MIMSGLLSNVLVTLSKRQLSWWIASRFSRDESHLAFLFDQYSIQKAKKKKRGELKSEPKRPLKFFFTVFRNRDFVVNNASRFQKSVPVWSELSREFNSILRELFLHKLEWLNKKPRKSQMIPQFDSRNRFKHHIYSTHDVWEMATQDTLTVDLCNFWKTLQINSPFRFNASWHSTQIYFEFVSPPLRWIPKGTQQSKFKSRSIDRWVPVATQLSGKKPSTKSASSGWYLFHRSIRSRKCKRRIPPIKRLQVILKKTMCDAFVRRSLGKLEVTVDAVKGPSLGLNKNKYDKILFWTVWMNTDWSKFQT